MKTGEELKLDVLLSNADKVQHQSREWTEVWKRGHGVQNDQLNDRDGNLIINNFTANDAGTYRVLDPDFFLTFNSHCDLITVTVEGEKKIRIYGKIIFLSIILIHFELSNLLLSCTESPEPHSQNGSKQLSK